MNGWENLKPWQKAGIIVGGIHFIIFFATLALAPPVAGYLSLILEKPWGWIFEAMNFKISGFLDFVIFGIIGTACYAISASAIFWLAGFSRRKPDPG
jgi:hypothetical protein